MYTLTSNAHEYETKHHVYFLKPSVSDPHTVKYVHIHDHAYNVFSSSQIQINWGEEGGMRY